MFDNLYTYLVFGSISHCICILKLFLNFWGNCVSLIATKLFEKKKTEMFGSKSTAIDKQPKMFTFQFSHIQSWTSGQQNNTRNERFSF